MTDRNNEDFLPTEEELEERKKELEQQYNAAPSPSPPQEKTKRNPFADLLNFPTEIVKLPSAKFAKDIYPTNAALYVGEVEVEQMKSPQEEILTNKTYLEDGSVFDRLLNSVLVSPDISAEDLIEGDKNAILSHLRINAYGSNYPVKVACKACSNFFEAEMDLDQDIHEIGQDPPSLVKFAHGQLHVKLPVTEIEVVLDFLRSDADAKIRNILKTKQKLKKLKIKSKNGSGADTSEVTFREKLTVLLKSANGHEENEHLRYLIDNMHQKDIKFLKVAYNKYIPNVKISKVLKCPKCSLEAEREVGFNVDFFWPSD